MPKFPANMVQPKATCPNCGSTDTTDYLYPGGKEYAFTACNTCDEEFEDSSQVEEEEDEDEDEDYE